MPEEDKQGTRVKETFVGTSGCLPGEKVDLFLSVSYLNTCWDLYTTSDRKREETVERNREILPGEKVDPFFSVSYLNTCWALLYTTSGRKWGRRNGREK